MAHSGINSLKDFFPKEITFGKPHPDICRCNICLDSEKLYCKLVDATKKYNSHQVKSSKSAQICNFLNEETISSLSCANPVEFEELLNSYLKIWKTSIEGHPISDLNLPHEECCSCLVCSSKKEFIQKQDELLCKFNVDDLLEIIEEKPLGVKALNESELAEEVLDAFSKHSIDEEKVNSYLVCDPQKQVIISTKNGAVESIIDAQTHEEIASQTNIDIKDKEKYFNVNEQSDLNISQDSSKNTEVQYQKSNLKKISLSELADMCICEPGKLSPYCLKHAVAYCQHMENKLYEEGCSCSRDGECLFCQRLKCVYCSHERQIPSTCSFLNDDETDDITLKVSSWLDEKLLDVGVSPDMIKQLSEPLEHLKKDSKEEAGKECAGKKSKSEEKDLSTHLSNYMERNVIEPDSLNHSSINTNFTITDRMRDEILNMNELFDVRPFPRCYRLKGVMDSTGDYIDLDEEYEELGFVAWKVPTQFVEETFPISGTIPDLEVRLDKENDIRKRTKYQISSSIQKKNKITGLANDWKPIVEVSPDNSDYNEVITMEQRQEWAQKTYEEILDKSEGLQRPAQQNDMWAQLQPILDKFGEEIVPKINTHDELKNQLINLDEYLGKHFESAKYILERFKNTGIGYKPEFWKGLEDWVPDKSENEARKRLKDEAKKFYKELDSFKNDFERDLVNNPGVEVDVESTINNLVHSLPDDLSEKISKLLNDLPSEWLENPEIGLMEMEQSSFDVNRRLEKNHSKSDTRSLEGVSDTGFTENEMSQDSDYEDFTVNSGEKQESFLYDDVEMDENISKADQIEQIRVSESEKAETSTSLKESISEEKVSPDEIQQKLKGISIKRRYHTPIPYVEKLKEEMLKCNPDGLHPVQKCWYDRPMFPFWTPSVVYDLVDIEEAFFKDVPDYSPNITESQLKELHDKLINNKGNSLLPKSSNIFETSIEKNTDVINAIDEQESSSDAKHTSLLKSTSETSDVNKTSANDSKKKIKSIKKTVSDDDCLIKEDDFKAAIEQMLKAQDLKKIAVKEDLVETAGALSLEKILKGIAGRVISTKEGAIKLDSSQNINLETIVPTPAITFPFRLDIFQKQAIIALEAGLSVFVAAHTSAGKTVAAEYAIAMALRNSCRVVYTSPIKALSNQKYNDFTKKFKGTMKIGIITGDVQLNIEAECLIMTTEILRSMLYNQSSILSDLEFVIFDEVHYFNDPERGNVWEEVLILLPHHCQLIMLSATVPNVMSFASWVGTLRKRTVIVTSTIKRPVPLKHYIHFSTNPKSIKMVLPLKEAEGPFLAANYQKAMASKVAQNLNSRHQGSKEWAMFIKEHLEGLGRLPAVVFCFSRKRCDELASSIVSVDLVVDAKKKSHIDNFFNRQINRLQPEDRDLRQIVTMKSLLQRGIGVHHSGILPILKEIVEVLFSESHIKLLFATETFAMGVNMPAKSVVFQQTNKFDGTRRRALKPAEYTQMAGRAGRRGIDKSGTVIIAEWNAPDKCIEVNELDNMLTGEVDPLTSQFRLRYSMILTALKPEGDNSIESIIGKSFFNFSSTALRNTHEKLNEKGYKELTEIGDEMKCIPPALRDRLCDYCNIISQYFNQFESIREKMFEHKQYRNFLQIGRVVTVCYKKYVNIFGIIVNICSKTYDIVVPMSWQFWVPLLKEKYPSATDEDEDNWYRLVGYRKMELLPLNHIQRMECSNSLMLIHCKAHHIQKIVKNMQIKLTHSEAQSLIDALTKQAPKKFHQNSVLENVNSFFVASMHMMQNFIYLDDAHVYFMNKEIREEIKKWSKMSQALQENLSNVKLLTQFGEYKLLDYLATCFWFTEKKKACDKLKVQAQKEELKSLFTDFESKLKFLKKYKYIKEDDDVVDTKGRIAGRMTNLEVFVTEILLKNVLEDLDGPETAALLSCLVLPSVKTERTDSSANQNPLFKPFMEDIHENDTKSWPSRPKYVNKELKKAHNNLANHSKNCKDFNDLLTDILNLPDALYDAICTVESIRIELITEEETLNIEPMEGSDLNKVSFHLVPIVYAWAKGRPVKQIMSVLNSSIQEGILVRWIINLHEVIKGIDSGTHHFLKDPRIKEKFETAMASIKRGIIDTPSLYLNQRIQPL